MQQKSFEDNTSSNEIENVPRSNLDLKNSEQAKTKINENIPSFEPEISKYQHSKSESTKNNKNLEELDDDTVSLPDAISYQSDGYDRSKFEMNKSSIPNSTKIFDRNLQRKKTNIFTCKFCNRQFNKKILLKKTYVLPCKKF